MPAPPPLWLSFSGAPSAVMVGWLVWMAVVAATAPVLSLAVGPAGGVITVLAIGWVLAHRGAVPSDHLHRFHLDDAELVVMGPGRRVRRYAWTDIGVLAQERQVLRFEMQRTCLRLPLGSLVATAGWNAVLTRVAAALAAETWELIEDGERVTLTPRLDPSGRALGWWAYAPALLACSLGAGPASAALGLGFALAERVVALGRRRAGAVALDRTGVTLRAGRRRIMVPWADAVVARAPRGLVVGMANGASGLVASRLPNYTAVAPVIETKAQLGSCSAPVQFRVRVADGALTVVGEVEPSA